MGELLPVCLICRQTPPEGIGAGIFIRKHFICRECEQKIVNAQPDKHNYAQIINCLKRVWA